MERFSDRLMHSSTSYSSILHLLDNDDDKLYNTRLEHLFSFVNICTSCGILVRIGSKIFSTMSARLPLDSSHRTKTHFI